MWLTPPKDLSLRAGQVHLWRANLDRQPETVEELSAILSEDERARAARFYFPQHRQRFTVARGILRRILERYLGIGAEQVQFEYGSRGKPRLAASCKGGGWEFNLSHSQGLALYGMTRDRRIGVDLEWLRPLEDLENLAARFYTKAEFATLVALPPEARAAAFFRGWTAKEAYLKATGDGLGGGLERVEVSLVPHEPLRLLQVGGDWQVGTRWSLWGLNPHPDYMAAIAVECQPILDVRYWQLI